MKTKILTPAQIKRHEAAIDRQIAAKNAKFKKATPIQKRIMVVKDVLERLNARQVKPEQGDWVNIPKLTNKYERLGDSCSAKADDQLDDLLSSSLQDKIVKERVSCTCCALGGLLTSCVAIKNELTVDDFLSDGLDGGEAIKGFDMVGLSDIFSHDQLSLIEFVFEKGQGYVSDNNSRNLEPEVEKVARAFIRKYPKVRDRYRAIFENILANEGTFKP